jgi:hypothetical protein
MRFFQIYSITDSNRVYLVFPDLIPCAKHPAQFTKWVAKRAHLLKLYYLFARLKQFPRDREVESRDVVFC